MVNCWFVTGTDTDVGKTWVSCGLLQAAARLNYRAVGYKPVASGSEMTIDGLRNSDALALQEHSNVVLSYHIVNPVTLVEATSPHIAADIEGRVIELAELSSGLRKLEKLSDWILIEGAGGWYTPLSAKYTFADWVEQEKLPVILVVGVKLGCINHALLTAQAILQRGLPLVGWVGNSILPVARRHTEYMVTLQNLLPAPLLGVVPYLSGVDQHDIGQYLDVGLLLS